MISNYVEGYTAPVYDFFIQCIPFIGILFFLALITLFIIKIKGSFVLKKSSRVIDRECVMPWADYEVIKHEMFFYASEGSKKNISRT